MIPAQMKTLFLPFLLAAALTLCASASCRAQATEKALDGYIGAGAVTMSRYTGSDENVTRARPLMMFEYRETFYVYLDRAGVRLWSTDDKKVALGIAAEPRFGFRAKDGPRLAGMATRRDRIEGGPTIEWETDAFSLSAAYFTALTQAGSGQSLRLTLAKQLVENDRWDVNVYAGVERDNAKTVERYFGVRSDEARADRPAYQPGASTNPVAGFTGAYKMGNGYAVLFGANTMRLGSAAAASPIVARKRDVTAFLGLAVAF